MRKLVIAVARYVCDRSGKQMYQQANKTDALTESVQFAFICNLKFSKAQQMFYVDLFWGVARCVMRNSVVHSLIHFLAFLNF